MAIVLTTNDTLSEIINQIEKLSPKQQHQLLMKLKKDDLLALSKKISKGVKPGPELTGAEIAERVNKNRKKWKKTS